MKLVRGTKSMEAKYIVTAYVCTNADGSKKLPLALIRKFQNSRCFRLGQSAVPYFNHENAWYDIAPFKR